MPAASRSLRRLLLALGLALATTTAAQQAADVEPYRLGPEDELQVTIHSGGGDEKGMVLNFPVAGDGTIDVAGAGRLKVSGLTTSEVQERIRRKLIDTGYLARPFVSVNVTNYLSQCVNVAGAVVKQGRLCLTGPTRLLDILSRAEGVEEESAGRVIVINRVGAEEPIRVDRRELVGADAALAKAANVRVLGGDNIYVPVKARACISGPLEKAGCYAFDEGATLQELIAMAEGLRKDQADRRSIVIRRRSGEEIRVNLDELAAAGAAAPMLEPDDQVIVGEVRSLRFCVNGQVGKPDCYDLAGDVTIEGAVSKAAGFIPNKAAQENVIVRRIVDGRIQELTVDVMKQGPEGAGFLIVNDDQITVPALDCLITVSGGVREARQVEYTTGMTLTDALSAAGGTTNEQGFALGKINAVILRRGDSVQTVDARAIMRGRGTDIKLQCGDRVTVPTRAIGGGGAK